MWVQDDGGEWYGEVCPEEFSLIPEFRVQDVANDINDFGAMYENTIETVFSSFCPPGDEVCAQGGSTIAGIIQGDFPDQGEI